MATSGNGVRVLDEQLKISETISGSSADYSTSINITDVAAATGAGLELVVDLTVTSGTFVFSLIHDGDSDLSSGATTVLTMPSKTASGLFIIPIPSDITEGYIGLSLTAVAHAGSYDAYLQVKGA